jgi:purine catabolism regulator
MLPLAELLKDPIFAQARVLAGQQNLSNPVEWSHIIDVPDVVANTGRNYLVLTTGQGFPRQPAEQGHFIADLAQAGLAGLVISVGNILQEVPPAIVQAAKQHHFPLIELPASQRFVEITRVIHGQLLSHQYALLRQSDQLHQALNQIVLEGGGLQEVANLLARLVKRPVTIEDPDLNLLAFAAPISLKDVDPAREESISAGGTPPNIRRFLTESRILNKINQNLRPTVVPAQPQHGMTKERIVAPILVERQVYGYLWLIAGDTPLDESDSMAIERAAMVAALTMLKDMAVQQTEARLQADVISQLLSDDPNSLAVEDKANRLGLDLNLPQRVLLIQPPEKVVPSLRQATKLSHSLNHLSQKHIVQPLGQKFILILPGDVEAQSVCQALLNSLPGAKIGVGEPAPTLVELSHSHQQASEALKIGLALDNRTAIYHFAQLGFLHWLYQIPPSARSSNPYLSRIHTLATEERAARAHLLRTLEVFLDCGGNASETARLLKIHRNTLSYRLKQIELLCNISLTSPDDRLNLQIAIKAHRLQGNGG